MIKILQHYTKSFEPLIEFSRPIHEEYCKKHGYELVINKHEYQKYNGLHKMGDIFGEFYKGERGDFLFVLDADCFITNMEIPIEQFIDDSHDLFLCGNKDNFNMGSFIIKNSSYSSMVLLLVNTKIFKEKCNCEQDAMEWFVKNNSIEKIKFIPHPSFNSYPCELYPEHGNNTETQGCWKEGNFILHVPAQPIEKRLEYFKKAKIVR